MNFCWTICSSPVIDTSFRFFYTFTEDLKRRFSFQLPLQMGSESLCHTLDFDVFYLL